MYFNWTVKARRRLRRHLARDIGRLHDALTSRDPGESAPTGDAEPPCHAAATDLVKRVEAILDKSFPGAEAITIQDQLVGFRPDKGIITLHVEVFHKAGGVGGAHVIKIGPVVVLEAELAAWRCCRPEGLQHDLVLLPLSEGFPPGEAGRTAG